MNFYLRCLSCGNESDATPEAYVCPKCGKNTEVKYRDIEISRDSFLVEGVGIERFSKVLPVKKESIPPMPVGPTPLIECKSLSSRLGLKTVWVKDDGRLPSASFKDRASAVALARAIDIGAKDICTASTGNGAAALACLGASAGIQPIIFVPKSAPIGKIAQLVTYGANIFLVDGTYDDACDLSLLASNEFGWFNRSTGYNPYTREGKKTVSFEILMDLSWEVPDYVVVPVGDGNIISGVYKGFLEAKEWGLVDKIPRMIAAQAEGSAAVSNAFNSKKEIEPVSASTVADSIAVDDPRDGLAAVIAVKESNGMAITVSDEQIMAGQKELASSTGIFAEPAAACGYAVLKSASEQKLIDSNASVVLLITGNGLKDVGAVSSRAPELPVIKPTIDDLRQAMEKQS